MTHIPIGAEQADLPPAAPLARVPHDTELDALGKLGLDAAEHAKLAAGTTVRERMCGSAATIRLVARRKVGAEASHGHPCGGRSPA